MDSIHDDDTAAMASDDNDSMDTCSSGQECEASDEAPAHTTPRTAAPNNNAAPSVERRRRRREQTSDTSQSTRASASRGRRDIDFNEYYTKSGWTDRSTVGMVGILFLVLMLQKGELCGCCKDDHVTNWKRRSCNAWALSSNSLELCFTTFVLNDLGYWRMIMCLGVSMWNETCPWLFTAKLLFCTVMLNALIGLAAFDETVSLTNSFPALLISFCTSKWYTTTRRQDNQWHSTIQSKPSQHTDNPTSIPNPLHRNKSSHPFSNRLRSTLVFGDIHIDMAWN